MFTPAMTNKEIQHEAFLDFLEMKGKIQIAFSEFLKNQNTTNGKQYLIHSIVQSKQSVPVRGRDRLSLFEGQGGVFPKNGLCPFYAALQRTLSGA